LKVGSPAEENIGSPSVSVGELWPEIDLLDEVIRGGTSVVPVQGPHGDQTSHSHADLQGSRKWDEGSSRIDQKALIDGAPGWSFALPCGSGGGSTKNKAAQILANASRAISSRMRHSFVDRQYSPLTGIYWTEWEIILEDLTCMVLLVKQEPISEGEDQ
jgi:hypothetical protein